MPITLLLATIGLLGADEKITFMDHVQPALANTCGSCHNPDKRKGGLDLTSMSAVIAGGSGGAVVDAGNPAGSRLLKILRRETEPKMPPDGPMLEDTKITLVEKWIAGGLLETKDGKPAARAQPTSPAFAATIGKPNGPPVMPVLIPIEPAAVVERNSPVLALAAAPWAPLFAVGGECQVSLYHLDTLMPLGVLPFPEGGPYVLRFSADGRWLIAAGGQGAVSGKVIIWDVETGRRGSEIGRERDAILAADVHPDMTTVAMGGSSRKIKFYRAIGDDPFQEIKKHTDWLTATRYSPDGVLLATGDRNGGVMVWESDTQVEFQTLRGHEKNITALAWRPDGNLLASASDDGTIRFWDMNTGTNIKNWPAHGGGVLDASWSHDGLLASGGRDGKVKVWKNDGSLLKELAASADAITRVAFAHDGKRVVSGDFTGTIVVWDINGTRLGSFPANPPTLHERMHADTLALGAARTAAATAVAACNSAMAARAACARTHATIAKQIADAEILLRDTKAHNQQSKAAAEKAAAQLADAEKSLKEFVTPPPNMNGATNNTTAAQAEKTRHVQSVESLRARLQTARKETAEATTAMDLAIKAMSAFPARKKEVEKQLGELAQKEQQAVADRDAAASKLAAAIIRIKRWQAEPLLLAAHKAREDVWRAQESAGIYQDAVAAATAVQTKWINYRDETRKAVVDSKPWSQVRLCLAQLAVNAARRHLATAQTAAENAGNFLARQQGVARERANVFNAALK